MACTMAAVAPVAVRPQVAGLKQAKNTFAARTVSNGSIKKTSAMQGERRGLPGPAAARAAIDVRLRALPRPADTTDRFVPLL